MSYHYAIIDEQNRCCGFAPNSPGEIIAGNYIPIETPNAVNLWDVWTGETWEKGTPPEPETPEEPTTDGRLTALEEQLLATDEVAVSLYEQQLAQEEINIAQDEAIVALYEMMEV